MVQKMLSSFKNKQLRGKKKKGSSMTELSFRNQTRTLLYTFTFHLLVSTYTALAKCKKIKIEFRTEKCKKVMKRNKQPK